VRNRSGDRFKPSTLRGYEQALRLRIFPEIGPQRLSNIRRCDLQDLVDTARLPGRPQQRRIIAAYASSPLEATIKAGLIGEPVQATLTLRQPQPGTSLTPHDYEVTLVRIGHGPPESSHLPRVMFEIDDEIDE